VLESGGFRDAEHRVHVLDRLARGALTRSSRAETRIARFATRSRERPTRHRLVPRTCRVAGRPPSGSSLTKGSSR